MNRKYLAHLLRKLSPKRTIWFCLLAVPLLFVAGIIVPSVRNCAELGGGPALAHMQAFRKACGTGCCPEVARRFNARKVYTDLWSHLVDKDARVYVGDTSRDGVCSYVVNFHGRFPCHDFGMLWDSKRPTEFDCTRCGVGQLFEAAGFKVNYSR